MVASAIPVTTDASRWRLARATVLLLLVGALAVTTLLSLRIGALGLSTSDTVAALFQYDPDSYEQTVVRSLRLPRTLIGLGAGAALAVSGAVMQAATRNPLAGPSILGVSSGASFAVVSAIYFLGISTPSGYVWFAFVGAAAASLLVYGIASAGRGGATPVKLALSGVIVSALLASWSTALLLLDQETLDRARFWSAGSLAGRPLDIFWTVSPFLVLGLAGALLMSRQLNVMSMGEDTAKALGLHTGRVRLVSALLVVMMTGAAVAAAGPIGFVGLAVPHIVRVVSGPDYRWVLAYCLVVGPTLLLGADIMGRLVVRPAELQVGIITAFCGAPFLIVIARRRRVAGL
ncbi:MAG: iron ABC transporter permease [Dehalococcoidia bacterium]|nr:iron ABC transporter permease [Dehalococcoidia bacterium]